MISAADVCEPCEGGRQGLSAVIATSAVPSLPARGGWLSRSERGWGDAGEQTHHLPTRPLAYARVHPPLAGRDGTARVAGVRVHCGFTFQTARRASVSAPGNASAPGRRPSCPPRKQSRRVKRRKALVRNPPHPVATLRSGQSLHRKGLPAHDAGRRALRRFTAVISVEASLSHARAALLDRFENRRPVVQQAPCTRVVLPAGSMPEAPRESG